MPAPYSSHPTDDMPTLAELDRDEEELTNGHCEDYPCCGHTAEDPCTRQWYDEPDAFNPRVNPHCFCDHEIGDCNVDYED